MNYKLESGPVISLRVTPREKKILRSFSLARKKSIGIGSKQLESSVTPEPTIHMRWMLSKTVATNCFEVGSGQKKIY